LSDAGLGNEERRVEVGTEEARSTDGKLRIVWMILGAQRSPAVHLLEISNVMRGTVRVSPALGARVEVVTPYLRGYEEGREDSGMKAAEERILEGDFLRTSLALQGDSFAACALVAVRLN
jgi:hypothetical protein